MNEQDKQLLLKVLCAMLPYGVKCCVYGDANDSYELSGFKGIDTAYFETLDWKENDGLVSLQFIKPYLRPMSSMTEEERNEYLVVCTRMLNNSEFYAYQKTPHLPVDWLNAHHFDHRELIPMGLALEAPEGMYETKSE